MKGVPRLTTSETGLLPTRASELQALFRAGWLPHPPPEGRFHGIFLRTTILPLLDSLNAALAQLYMPWRGKRFERATGRGDNRFHGGAYLPFRLLWPRYKGIRRNPDGTLDAFAFRTWAGPGVLEPETTVLKIDYDLPENPGTLRRVLDELVTTSDGRLLGRAHLKTWWGRWAPVAYFALIPAEEGMRE